MFGIGMTELLVILVVGLLVLGPKRLPELARSLGRSMAEFRRASMDLRKEFMDVAEEARIEPPHLEPHARASTRPHGDTDDDAGTARDESSSPQVEAPEPTPGSGDAPRDG